VTRSDRFGVSYQLTSVSWERDPDPVFVHHWESRRSSGALRAFFAPLGDRGVRPRLDVTLAHTRVSGDSAVPPRERNQAIVDAGIRTRTAHVGATGRLSNGDLETELEGRASWSPGVGVTLAVEGRRTTYSADRTGTRALASLGLSLPAGFALRGQAVWSRDPQAPALAGDTVQETRDVYGALHWVRSWLTLEVGAGERDGFAPVGGPAGLRPIADLRSTPQTRYLSVHGTLRPTSWLSISGWYFDPLDGGGDFEPPHHGRVALTLFSRFLRRYPSGAFVLRAQVAMESWGSWTAGVAPGGAPLDLDGASFLDLHITMQIADVTAFWTMRNANATRASYVPGLRYPVGLQYYGVRWDFRN
jgi:hypothetical protein